ncbi:hypothetical protein Gasu2_23980 [Galdieria sulphuraria]|nr:hypothetical protein Gasu2_23980 [Galdieria sulphuraria]
MQPSSMTKRPFRASTLAPFDAESFEVSCEPKQLSLTFEFDPKQPSFETQFVYSPQTKSKLYACYNFEKERFRYLGVDQRFRAFDKDNSIRLSYFLPRNSLSASYHIQADEKNKVSAHIWFHDVSNRGLGKREERLELQSNLEEGEYSYFSKDSQAAAVSVIKQMDKDNVLKAGADWRNRKYLLEWTSLTGDGPWVVKSALGFQQSLRDFDIQLKHCLLCDKKMVLMGFQFSLLGMSRTCLMSLNQRRTSVFSVLSHRLTMRQAESLGKINYSITESQSNKYILIQYQPPVEYFRSGQDLFYTGGYNNWSGVDNPLILPLRQKKADLYEVLVPLPEGSVSVEFAFTDGVVYDTNHGAFYHIPLEQFVTEEENNSHHIENVSENTKLSELDPLKIPEGPTRYTNDEEIALRKARAEATAVGESMGLSNVLMTEARTEFERFDTRMSGDKEFHEWTLACKEYSRDEDMENIHITEFIYLYGSLELRNEGLQIL